LTFSDDAVGIGSVHLEPAHGGFDHCGICPRSLESVRNRLAGAPRPARVARSAIPSIKEMTAPPGVRGFTDDLAPVEAMTRHMLGDP
jgi:hypothetical protein